MRLPESDSTAAIFVAQRLCEMVASVQWDIGNGSQIPITISIGIASCPDPATTSRALIGAADKALYMAKETGRNRACNYGAMSKSTTTTS